MSITLYLIGYASSTYYSPSDSEDTSISSPDQHSPPLIFSNYSPLWLNFDGEGGTPSSPSLSDPAPASPSASGVPWFSVSPAFSGVSSTAIFTSSSVYSSIFASSFFSAVAFSIGFLDSASSPTTSACSSSRFGSSI